MHVYVHRHMCVSFLCRSDARAMAQNIPITSKKKYIYLAKGKLYLF